MNILLLAPNLPYPPNSGGRIRVLELLRFLQARHRVTLATFVLDEYEQVLVQEVARFCARVITVKRPRLGQNQQNPKNDHLPWRIREFCIPDMQAALQSLDTGENFDILDVEHIFMAQFAPLIHAPAILQEHNIESQIQKHYAEVSARYAGGKPLVYTPGREFYDVESEWPKLAAYEDSIWPRFPARVVVSDLDRQEMEKRCPSGKVLTVPNGVNIKEICQIKMGDQMNVLFVGTLAYQPNLDAAFELCDVIWPLVKYYVPDACLYVVGREPPPELLSRQVPGSLEIVPEAPDLAVYAKKCSVCAVPLRVGGGTRMKILTAMAFGLPVVSTTAGYMGLTVHPGRDLLVADEPEQFARCLVQLLLSPELRVVLGHSGRQLVETQYNWERIFPALEDAFEVVVQDSRK